MISQSGECIVRLSRYLLNLNEGDRVMPKSELAGKYSLAVGTVQAGFKALEDAGAVSIRKRGVLGSFIEKIDKAMLWDYSMYGYIRGTMPLPYHDLLIGLASGINSCFDPAEGIMLRMSYIRGSRSRIENVASGIDDFTVCSVFAAECAAKAGVDIRIFKELSANTYMGRAVLLLRKGAQLQSGITVGIDTASYDQEMLTRQLLANYEVNYSEVNYNNFAYMLNKGYIDACIWSAEDIGEFQGEIATLPEDMQQMIDKAGKAALIISGKSECIEKMSCVENLFDTQKIEEMQQQVKDHKAIPNY